MKKVLIMEDELNIRSFVVINLKRAGYDVIEAGDGQQALDAIAANPDVIVVSSLDRNRWALDKAEEKIKFLKSDPAVSQLEAVKKGHIVVMDGQAMNPTIRTLYGAEQVGEQLRKMGLN